MRIRRMLVGLALAATLAGATSAVALAGPGGPPPEVVAARCDRGQALLERLETRVERIAARIVAVQARLESGELNERRTARAERILARLERRAERVANRIERLSAKLAEKCPAADAEASARA